jgi:hypothetical protein
MKTCNCINEVDDEFREQNLKLVGYAFMMPDFRPVVTIRTEWVKKADAPKGKKNSPPSMMATYCPFCGVKYAEPKTANDKALPQAGRKETL